MKKIAGMMVAVALLGLVGSSGACSSSGGSSGSTGTGGAAPADCAATPLSCGAGKTCWPILQDGSSFECVASGAGKEGDTCSAFVGQASCGDGLFCLALATTKSTMGTCLPYCDAAHACPSGDACSPASLGDPAKGAKEFSICIPPNTTTSSSSSGTGTGGGSGTSSSSGGTGTGGGSSTSSSAGGTGTGGAGGH